MRKMKKIVATAFAIGALFIANGVFACEGHMWACLSWQDQMQEDIENNCDGDSTGLDIDWIDC